MSRKTLCLLPFLLFPACGRKTVIPPAASGISGVVQERFLPNPVHGAGAPVRVTPLGGESVLVYAAASPQTKVSGGSSDGEGKFFIEVPPGDYEVVLDRAEMPRKRVKVEPGKATNVTLEKVIAPP
jgi:hypothetical protein